jgi:hypothetical protein
MIFWKSPHPLPLIYHKADIFCLQLTLTQEAITQTMKLVTAAVTTPLCQ